MSESFDDLITDVPDEVKDLEEEAALKERLTFNRAQRKSIEILDAEAAVAARGPRIKRNAREFALVERPKIIMDRTLAAEVNLLGGPSEAGKSLLARDWCMSVAAGVPWMEFEVAEQRNVLWIGSEGMHDFDTRFQGHRLWEKAADHIYVLDETVNLTSGTDVQWLLDEYAEERPGLVVFDVIYGMGMADDNGVKDVSPVLAAMKKISAQWGAATLALGHPPGGDQPPRRFRGSSMWRQLAYTDWHMASGRLTCEKSKIADKSKLSKSYVREYPAIRWMSTSEVIGNAAAQHAYRETLIRNDIVTYPGESDSKRANRLAELMELSPDRVRALIRDFKKANT